LEESGAVGHDFVFEQKGTKCARGKTKKARKEVQFKVEGKGETLNTEHLTFNIQTGAAAPGTIGILPASAEWLLNVEW
jgi:hypothetical protein